MPWTISRRAFFGFVVPFIFGCDLLPGERVPNPDENPAFGAVTQRGDLQLSSPVIEEGGEIPIKYGHFFLNANPPLEISGVPDSARSLALVMDGPDAPGGEFTNWLVWNIPPDIREIPEGWDPPPSVVEGANSTGKPHHQTGYFGPDPPNRQTYRFKLFAVDTMLDLPAGAEKRALGKALKGNVLAQTQLTAWYDFHTAAHDSISSGGGHNNLLATICEFFNGFG